MLSLISGFLLFLAALNGPFPLYYVSPDCQSASAVALASHTTQPVEKRVVHLVVVCCGDRFFVGLPDANE